MKISYLLEANDLLQFNKFHVKNSLYKKRFFLILLSILTVIYFTLITVPITDASNTRYVGYLLFILLIIMIIFLLYKFFSYLLIKLHIKLIAKDTKNNVFGECKISTTDEALLGTIKGNKSKYLWKDIHNIKESDNYLFIYTSITAAITIPIFKIDPLSYKAFKEEVLKLYNYNKS